MSETENEEAAAELGIGEVLGTLIDSHRVAGDDNDVEAWRAAAHAAVEKAFPAPPVPVSAGEDSGG
jgi:hypothetical protein